MSGEQHMPTTAAEEAQRRWPEGDPALHRWDGLTIDARRSYLVQRQAFEAGAGWATARVTEVRALPDREAVALIVRAALCGCRRSTNVHGEGMGRRPDERYTQVLVDALFALFAQEGQR